MLAIKRETLPSYAFGPFVLNGNERTLLRNGESVTLTPKVFETLLVLVENHGRVLTKSALMDALWPETFVEESSLAQNISLLRKALANPDDDQTYIETIPKRGYRFIGDVRKINTDESKVLGYIVPAASRNERIDATQNIRLLRWPPAARSVSRQ